MDINKVIPFAVHVLVTIKYLFGVLNQSRVDLI